MKVKRLENSIFSHARFVVNILLVRRQKLSISFNVVNVHGISVSTSIEVKLDVCIVEDILLLQMKSDFVY